MSNMAHECQLCGGSSNLNRILDRQYDVLARVLSELFKTTTITPDIDSIFLCEVCSNEVTNLCQLLVHKTNVEEQLLLQRDKIVQTVLSTVRNKKYDISPDSKFRLRNAIYGEGSGPSSGHQQSTSASALAGDVKPLPIDLLLDANVKVEQTTQEGEGVTQPVPVTTSDGDSDDSQKTTIFHPDWIHESNMEKETGEGLETRNESPGPPVPDPERMKRKNRDFMVISTSSLRNRSTDGPEYKKARALEKQMEKEAKRKERDPNPDGDSP